MYWTLELASKLEDAPWPATKDESIKTGRRSLARNQGRVNRLCHPLRRTAGGA